MSAFERCETAFAEWVESHEVAAGITSQTLKDAHWPNSSSTDTDSSRWIFAANVCLVDNDFTASAEHFVTALRLDGGLSYGCGYETLISCFPCTSCLNSMVGSPEVASTLEKALRERYGRTHTSSTITPPSLTRNRNVDDSYHAVATFQSCVLYLHAKLPTLSLPDLHNLCYFVDAVYFQQYGLSLFGTPRRAATGVTYDVELRGDVQSILDGVAGHFSDAMPATITEVTEAEPPVESRELGHDVLFSCMRAELLQPSDTVRGLLERSPVTFGAATQQVPMNRNTRISSEHTSNSTVADIEVRLEEAIAEVHRLQLQLSAKLAGKQ